MTGIDSRLAQLSDAELLELDQLLLAECPVLPHSEYATDPIGWAVDKLGIPEHTLRWSLNVGYPTRDWDGTPDPLATAFEAIRDWKDCSIESATGTGKSYGAAILLLWFLACFENSQVYTFALTADQLRLYIWRNVAELWPAFSAHFPTAELTSLGIRMRGGIDETWAAHPKPVQVRAGESVSTRAAGMHAEHMLLIYEEAAGQEWAVMEAGRNTCTAPHNLRLAIGNPNYQLDSLHRFSEQPGVVAVRCSALDHPNVVTGNAQLIPGAVSRKSIESRRLEYGEDDPVYKSRVRGISPEQAANALIRLEWLKAAAARYLAKQQLGTLPKRVTGKGVDAANSEHGDRACIVDFAENVVIRVHSFNCPDSNVLGAQVVAESHKHALEGRRVGIDAIGVGAGTVNEARRLNFPVTALYAGGGPLVMAERAVDGQRIEWQPDVNKFKTLRAQMYWQLREDFRKGTIDLEERPELWKELTILTFEDDGQKVIVLPKDDVKALLGRSPDEADALAMANWVRKRSVDVREKLHFGSVIDYQAQKVKVRQTAEEELRERMNRGKPQQFTTNRFSIPTQRRGR